MKFQNSHDNYPKLNFYPAPYVAPAIDKIKSTRPKTLFIFTPWMLKENWEKVENILSDSIDKEAGDSQRNTDLTQHKRFVVLRGKQSINRLSVITLILKCLLIKIACEWKVKKLFILKDRDVTTTFLSFVVCESHRCKFIKLLYCKLVMNRSHEYSSTEKTNELFSIHAACDIYLSISGYLGVDPRAIYRKSFKLIFELRCDR